MKRNGRPIEYFSISSRILPFAPIPSHSIRGSFSNEGSQMGDWRGKVCQRLTLPAKNLLHRSNIFLSILHLPSVLQLNCNLFSNQPRISKILLLGQKGTIHEFRNPSWFLLANANIYICLYSRTSLLLHRSNLYIIEWMHCLGNGNLFVGGILLGEHQSTGPGNIPTHHIGWDAIPNRGKNAHFFGFIT